MRIISFVLFVLIMSNVLWAFGMNVVRGSVRALTYPSPLDCAEEYAQSDELVPWGMRFKINKQLTKKGIPAAFIPKNAGVELRDWSSEKLLGKGYVNDEGTYKIQVSSKISKVMVYCTVSLRENEKDIGLVGWKNAVKDSDTGHYVADIVLRRDYSSVVGRCLRNDGSPAKGAFVKVSMRTTPIETSERYYDDHLVQTDEEGRWRVDGINTPPYDRLVSYVCNTNMIDRFDSTCPPLAIEVQARSKFIPTTTEASVTIPNVSADSRAAVEKTLAAYERKNGKPWRRRAPMVDFPVSTNNVIYVPDIILPRNSPKS